MRFRFGQVLARSCRLGFADRQHARIPVNGNLFGNISTHRRYSTARDLYFA